MLSLNSQLLANDASTRDLAPSLLRLVLLLRCVYHYATLPPTCAGERVTAIFHCLSGTAHYWRGWTSDCNIPLFVRYCPLLARVNEWLQYSTVCQVLPPTGAGERVTAIFHCLSGTAPYWRGWTSDCNIPLFVRYCPLLARVNEWLQYSTVCQVLPPTGAGERVTAIFHCLSGTAPYWL